MSVAGQGRAPLLVRGSLGRCGGVGLGLSLDMALTVVFVTHSVEEALLIGTRILVLSAHPGRVRAELAGVASDALQPGREDNEPSLRITRRGRRAFGMDS